MNIFVQRQICCVIGVMLSLLIPCQLVNAEGSETSLKDTLKIFNPFNYWKVTPGVGLHFVSIDLTRKSDGYIANLSEEHGDQYFSLDVESPAWMITDRYGLSFRSQTKTFHIAEQEVPHTDLGKDNKNVNIGTSVKGFLSYSGPTFFWTLKEGSFTRMERGGIGVVYWDAHFSGDVIFTKDLQASKEMQKTKLDSVIDGSLGIIYYYQWHGQRWMLELAGSLIETSNQDYSMTLQSTNLVFGYSF